MGGWVDKWMDGEQEEGWTDGLIMGQWLDRWMGGELGGWINAWMNTEMDTRNFWLGELYSGHFSWAKIRHWILDLIPFHVRRSLSECLREATSFQRDRMAMCLNIHIFLPEIALSYLFLALNVDSVSPSQCFSIIFLHSHLTREPWSFHATPCPMSSRLATPVLIFIKQTGEASCATMIGLFKMMVLKTE